MNERFFELHQHATAISLSSNVDGGSGSSSSESKLLTPSLCEHSSSAPPSSSLATFDSNDGHDIISLVYYDAERWDLVEELERQVHNLELKKRAGSASSSYAKIEKDINAKKVQLTKVKAAKKVCRLHWKKVTHDKKLRGSSADVLWYAVLLQLLTVACDS